MSKKNTDKIRVKNVNHPGSARDVDADMYEAMKRAFLKVLPKTTPGLTATEIGERVMAHLPERLFPGGAKAGWWAKTVELDLEARGTISRERSTPLRWHRA